jgi:hypothetical protein
MGRGRIPPVESAGKSGQEEAHKKEMPFNLKRMACGSFKILVDA